MNNQLIIYNSQIYLNQQAFDNPYQVRYIQENEESQYLVFFMQDTILSLYEQIILEQIPSGSTLLVQGFGLCDIPENSINALKNARTKNLTMVSNNCGTNDEGIGILLNNGQLRRVKASYAEKNHNLAKKYFDGELELELIPQGMD